MTELDDREKTLLIVSNDDAHNKAFGQFIIRQDLAYTIVIVKSVKEAHHALTTSSYDAIISDYLLGDGTAREIHDYKKSLPFIVVTGRGDEKLAIELMKLGASDYLIKDSFGDYLTEFPAILEKAFLRNQAEIELGFFRGKFNELIEERAAELENANEKLKAEILERKQAEQTLNYQAELFKKISEAVISTDVSFQILSWNNASENLYGWTSMEAIGEKFGEFLRVEYINSKPEEVLAEIEKNGIWTGEVIQYNKAGEKLFVNTSITNLDNSDGEVIGKVAVNRDITEAKHVQNELIAYQTHLETLVEERTSALNKQVSESAQLNEALTNLLEDFQSTNENLAIASRKLQEANQELEAFTYSVSHDLRAPLRAVDGFSQILLEDYADELPKNAVSYLTKVTDGAHQMGELIKDLLELSRLGRKPLQKLHFDCNEMVQKIIEDFDYKISKQDYEIKIHDFPNVYGDPALLKQVFVNLISNAIKFSSQNETPRIEIGKMRDDGEVRFYVKDNGVGFDMDYVENLFGVFQRLHSADQFEGTGVGLAIVQRIIRRHGGRVWAEGQVNKGATFFFTIPQDEYS